MRFSREQLRALGDRQRSVFEEKMIRHVQRFWSPEGQAMTDGEALEIVRAGIERAVRHGIKNEYDVGRFIDLSCALGQGFDERSPWANALAEPAPARLRVDQLCRTALDGLQERPDEE